MKLTKLTILAAALLIMACNPKQESAPRCCENHKPKCCRKENNQLIRAVAHLCIAATDLEKTKWFYCDLLGFEKHFDFLKKDTLVGFYVKVNNQNFIEFFRSSIKPEEFQKQHIRHLCLEVSDIDSISKKLIENNIVVKPKKLGSDNSWQIWCKDPNGVDIEFHQYTDSSSQITRKNCIVNW